MTMEGNNNAMREALEELVANIEMRSSTFGLNVMVDTKAFLDAKAALSAPPRNCDVGTAEEQEKRFTKYCIVQTCGTCPCFVELTNGDWRCNPFAWAQMPYEEGETK